MPKAPPKLGKHTKVPSGRTGKQTQAEFQLDATNRATALLLQMQNLAETKFGVKDFDPVLALVELGLTYAKDHQKMDHEGNPVWERDEDGELKYIPGTSLLIPVIESADPRLAKDCFKLAAPYVRAILRQVELTDTKDGPIDADVLGAKERLMKLAGLDTEPKVAH